MKLKDLNPNSKNPRVITDAKLKQLKKALTTFGDISGIVFNTKTKTLVGGHQRQKLFDSDAVITIVKKYSKPTKTGTTAEGFVELKGERFSYREVYWDATKQKAATIAANKNAGAWDVAQLTSDLDDLANLDFDFDFDVTMFDKDEIKEMGLDTVTVAEHERKSATGVDEDEVPEKAPARSRLGNVFRLGEHRLMCGDSTNKTHVEKLMNGQKADMVHTDPPYNVDYSNQDRPNAGKKDLGRIKNDKMSDKDFRIFLTEAFTRSFEVTKDNSTIYIWHASKESINFMQAIIDSNWGLNQQIIWKKPMLLGRGKYQWAHEPCILGVKGSPYFTEDRTKTTVWDFGGYDKSKNVHPTQKPVFIPEEAISNSSKLNEIVLDLFGGSGSTLIACEKTHRKCFMMELDPHYVDVIIDRWEKYTGQKATLVSQIKANIPIKPAPQPRSKHAENN